MKIVLTQEVLRKKLTSNIVSTKIHVVSELLFYAEMLLLVFPTNLCVSYCGEISTHLRHKISIQFSGMLRSPIGCDLQRNGSRLSKQDVEIHQLIAITVIAENLL